MPRPLDGAVGERLELPEYYADIDDNYARAKKFWKPERGQVYAEPDDESWKAFDGGDWEESTRLIEQRRTWLGDYFQRNSARGMVSRRVRIVSLPVTPYLQWELHGLRLRDELGQETRVLLDREVADFEDHGPLPDLNLLDIGVMYQVIYDDNGVAGHALRYADAALVQRCRDFIGDLFEKGEPIRNFSPGGSASPGAPPSSQLDTTRLPRTSARSGTTAGGHGARLYWRGAARHRQR